jgi:diguanylate cyclase (GGDEF)-like protein
MAFSYALNAVFGSALLLVLIFIDYYRKPNANVFQRGIFLKILVFDCIAMFSDFIYLSLRGRPGAAMHVLFILTGTCYYFNQIAGFCYKYLLLNFIAFQDEERIKKALPIAWSIIIINSIILLINLFKGYYFTVSPENFYVRGNRFYIRMIIAYIPAIITAGDIMLFSKNTKALQKYLWAVFLAVIGTGSTIDIILRSSTNLTWPCTAVSMLFAYFFIIKTDSRIDPLTGLGNRYSFIEFLNRADGRKPGRAWPVVITGMGNFREINETLGRREADKALIDTASLIKGCIGRTDFAARCGGAEFVIALKSGEDPAEFVKRLDESAARRSRNAGMPYRIEMNSIIDSYVPGDRKSVV